ncbi:hypothetical protein OHS81_21520 [Streptomyces sp. NBC_00400]|uniref:hypothetical protein n=1 Tax=Streptomyces sp. NBC_00400 TaxID=2975737 RepID=UPI002E207A93
MTFTRALACVMPRAQGLKVDDVVIITGLDVIHISGQLSAPHPIDQDSHALVAIAL